jgi:hypothetical protein
MKSKLVSFLSLFLFLGALIVPAVTAQAKGGGSGGSRDARIKLVAAPDFRGVKGAAKFRDRGGEQEFELEVQGAKRLSGATLTLSVDGTEVGQITIDPLGRGSLNLSSRRGQAVPAVAAGSLVRVATAGGAIVLTGVY